jgi:hypothetical protein
MAAMAFSFQFYDPVVKCVQLALQMLNFVLDRETRSGNSIDLFSGLRPHRKQVAGLTRRVVMASPPPYEKGPAIGGGALQSREKTAR